MKANIIHVGDWVKEIDMTLHNALDASVSMMGRTGEEACRHALILMAQSARAITMKAKKNRHVMQGDAKLGPYVDVYNQGSTKATRLYKWACGTGQLKNVTWDKAKQIHNTGLAKKSWMWGLGKLGASGVVGSPIPGTSVVRTITSEKVNGYIKENKLGYITKAMPSGWSAMVEMAVVKKIFAQAIQKMRNQHNAAIRSGTRMTVSAVRSLFRA